VRNGQLDVSTSRAATVFGFDAEAELLHNALLDLVPYTDLNFIKNAGWGFHGGVQVPAKMPVGFDLTSPIDLSDAGRYSERHPVTHAR
jgi:hypothetical protein